MCVQLITKEIILSCEEMLPVSLKKRHSPPQFVRRRMLFGATTGAKAWKRTLEHLKNESPLRKKIGLCFRYLAGLSTLNG